METHIHIPIKSPLQDFATALWEVKAMTNCRETILPQGVIEIIFNFSDPLTATLPFGKETMRAPKCFIQGMNTHVVQANCNGHHHLFGIRLHPHKIKQMFGIQPSELKNTTIDLSLLKPRLDILWDQMYEAPSFQEKINIIEKNISLPSSQNTDRSGLVSNLFISGGIDCFQTVEALAKEVCYSTRQLNRVSNNLFGISAEELTIYKKFMQSVHHIHHTDNSLTDVAYHSGFYDQAHFCRVFKSYTGITAKEYRNKKSETPFHIFS